MAHHDSTFGAAGEGDEEQFLEEEPITPSLEPSKYLDDGDVETGVADDDDARNHERSPDGTPSSIHVAASPSMGPPPLPMVDMTSQLISDEAVTPRLVPLASPGLPLVSPLIGRSGPLSGSYFPENIIGRSELDISGDTIDNASSHGSYHSPAQESEHNPGPDNDRQAQAVDPEIEESRAHSPDDYFMRPHSEGEGQAIFNLPLTASETGSVEDQTQGPTKENTVSSNHEQIPEYENEHFHYDPNVHIHEKYPSFDGSIFSPPLNLHESETAAIDVRSPGETDAFHENDSVKPTEQGLHAGGNLESAKVNAGRIPEDTVDIVKDVQMSREESINVTAPELSKDLLTRRQDLASPSQPQSSPVELKSIVSHHPQTSVWQEKLDIKAVECKVRDQQLSPPPFPFMQSWDREAILNLTQRRRSYQGSGSKGRIRYGWDGPSSDSGMDLDAAKSDSGLKQPNALDLSEEETDLQATYYNEDASPHEGILTRQRYEMMLRPRIMEGDTLEEFDVEPEAFASVSDAITPVQHAWTNPEEDQHDRLDPQDHSSLDPGDSDLTHSETDEVAIEKALRTERTPYFLGDTNMGYDSSPLPDTTYSQPEDEDAGGYLLHKDHETPSQQDLVMNQDVSGPTGKQVPSDLKVITPDNSQATTSMEAQTQLILPDNAVLLTPQHTQSSTGLQEIVAHARNSEAKDIERQEDAQAARRSPRLLRRRPNLDSSVALTAWPSSQQPNQARAHDISSNNNKTTSPTAKPEEKTEEDTIRVKPTQTTLPSLTKGLHTPLGYFTTLASLPSYFNQQVDVLAVATANSTSPKRASAGPRDHHTTLHTTDASLKTSSTSVNIFRPSKTALPALEKGDVVLLRDFKVQRRRGSMELLSTESSAWAIFHALSEVQTGATSIVKDEVTISGPPVEFGEAELRRSRDLMTWWEDEGQFHFVPAHETETRVTRSRQMLSESEEPQPDSAGLEGDKSAQDIKSPQQHASSRKLKVHTSVDPPLQHELRDGTRYIDPSPGSPVPMLHELRDGTKWFDFTAGSSRPGSGSSADSH